MDDSSQFGRITAWAGGATGVGVLAAAFAIPYPYGLYIAGAILILAILLFGGYILWRTNRARRQRERFSSALEAQTAAAPKAISDPNQRADLDRVRQKFQKGLQEFKSRGKNIYKLPWYVIIGESGSGKTEAIRHSGIDFPPGLQDELQGSGGTVNMDWWFTNRAIILDTAGSMIFNQARAGEAPEWREFLRLLKRARPHCPINGLFLVLSVESFIRDSAETIKDKASHLAQQLDLIQRTLDVRFPVYLLVTKCDLLIGFREFFDSIDDPLLQHQMFGWSNPEPLDAHFRPDLVEQHLKSVAERLRRRRLALLRTGSSGAGRSGDTQQFFASSSQLGRGPAGTRRLDEVDALFALPESVMRLVPRLRRYLETVFVAGEWSAKPVFLRGMYFTSSMREGKALDEAIAFATGLPLDQLPEDRSWEKNKAFFLRDLFIEKVFRESGLVTRATNTLKLLRQRQLAIFGSAVAGLLLLLVFASVAKAKLDASVKKEADLWKAAAVGWDRGVWLNGSIVTNKAQFKYAYAGANTVKGTKYPVVQFHQQLRDLVSKNLSGGWFFKPVSLVVLNVNKARREAARLLFEAGVLRPLVYNSREKMLTKEPAPAEINRHRDAWWSLLQLEADHVAPSSTAALIAKPKNATDHLGYFLSYLTEDESSKLDPNLLALFLGSYASKESGGKAQWPPGPLLAGDTLTTNTALRIGLDRYNAACVRAQTNIIQELARLNELTDELTKYYKRESEFLTNLEATCQTIELMRGPKQAAERLQSATNLVAGSLSARYSELAGRAAGASGSELSYRVELTRLGLSNEGKESPLVNDIGTKLSGLRAEAGKGVLSALEARQRSVTDLDTNCLTVLSNGLLAYEARWELYTNACGLLSTSVEVTDSDIGDSWHRYTNPNTRAEEFLKHLGAYKGPLHPQTWEKCSLIAQGEVAQLEGRFVAKYVNLAGLKLQGLTNVASWSIESVTNAHFWFTQIERDWNARTNVGTNARMLDSLRKEDLRRSRQMVLQRIKESITAGLGFPVFLDANPAKPMSSEGLKRLRSLVGGLPGVLRDQGWKDDSLTQLRSLEEDLARYSSVLTALVDANGVAATGRVFFVPPSAGTEDHRIRNIFRWARVTVGSKASEWKQISQIVSVPGLLGNGPIDSTIEISFRRGIQDPPTSEERLSYTNWWLPQLIRDEKFSPERLDNGKKWRFRLRLEDRQQKQAGNIVVDVDLDGALPSVEDWPRSR
jgi:hypothetical protein